MASVTEANKMIFVDAGCGDGRVMLVASQSNMFRSVTGCDVMLSQGECEWSYVVRMTGLGLETEYPQYGTSIVDMVLPAAHSLAVFSFLQGWKRKDMRQLAFWFARNNGKVLCICGHKSGQAATVSDFMIHSFWAPLLPGYYVKGTKSLHMAYGGESVTAVLFTNIR